MTAHPTGVSVLLREAAPVVCPPACVKADESKFRIWRVVQAWLEFARSFLNLLKKRPCFFNKPDEVYGNGDILCLYRMRYKSEKLTQKIVVVFLTKHQF
ncbi:MAG: hypothetical protein EBS96_12775, partial [Spartobacteria bacterium]|nr:hypothetical protein [Spartobacteria bacterium]